MKRWKSRLALWFYRPSKRSFGARLNDGLEIADRAAEQDARRIHRRLEGFIRYCFGKK